MSNLSGKIIMLSMVFMVGFTASAASAADKMQMEQGNMMQGQAKGGTSGMNMQGSGMGKMGMMGGMGGKGMGRGGMMGMMHGGGMGGGMMGMSSCGMAHSGTMSRKMMDMLNLSEDQRKKASKIHRAARKQHLTLLSSVLDARDDFKEAMRKKNADPKAVGKAFAAWASAKQKVIEATVKSRNDMRAILNKEQRKMLDNMMSGMGSMGMGQSGMGGMMK